MTSQELHEMELKLAAEVIRRGGDPSKVYAAFDEIYERGEE